MANSDQDALYRTIDGFLEKIGPCVVSKVQCALEPFGKFEVYLAKTGPSSLYVSINDKSAHHLSATVSVDVKASSWSWVFQPSKSPHISDHALHAGGYVLSKLETTSRVGLPSFNENTLDILDILHRAMAVTRVVRDAQLYIDTLMYESKYKVGEDYLRALQELPEFK